MAQPAADIGLIGLAVMGEKPSLNMESHGYTVAVFNRTTSKVDEFVGGRGLGKKLVGCHNVKDLVASLKRPRKIMIMVKAGHAVDAVLDELAPLLEPGDILIDGGNTHYPDSTRRTRALKEKGLLFVVTGVSGGEEGALKGPSIMPGGNPDAWEAVKPIFQAIAAKVGDGTPLLRLGRQRGRPLLRQDGPQRHRVRGYPAHLRGLPPHEGPGRPRRPQAPRGLRPLEHRPARQLPDRDYTRHLRLQGRRDRRADGRPDPRQGRSERHRKVDRDLGPRPGHPLDPDRRIGLLALPIGPEG